MPCEKEQPGWADSKERASWESWHSTWDWKERWELREEAPCRQEEPRKGTKAGVNLSCASVGER